MKKKPNPYPIYFISSVNACFCLLNQKEAMYIALYIHTAQIQYEVGNNGTWIHYNWREQNDLKQITKATFNKTYKKAMKILQKKLKI